MTAGRIISQPIHRADLAQMAEAQFGDWIKAVVDVSQGIMAVGGRVPGPGRVAAGQGRA